MQILKNFYQCSTTNSNQIAFVIDKTTYTYSDLAQKASLIAQQFQQKNYRRIAIMGDRSFSAYLGILATLWSGAAYVPVNPNWPIARQEDVKKTAQVDYLFNLADWENLLNPFKSPEITPPVDTSPTDLAYLIFTSGSTGAPKGVPVSQGNVAQFINAIQSRHQITAQDRVAQSPDIVFDISVYDIFLTWHSGATLYILPESQRLVPYSFIREHQITVWSSVPSVIQIMNRLNLLKPNCFPCLRISSFAGEALKLTDADLWQKAAPNSVIDNLYGPTEVTVECLAYRFNSSTDLLHTTQTLRGCVPIGKPLPEVLAALIDEKQNWLSTQGKGELLLAGPQVVAGYWQNPELTAQKFIEKNHPHYGTQRWYRTGDYCYQDENGIFHFLSRMDTQCKIHGHRVELEEIEYHLKKITGQEAAVTLHKAENTLDEQLIGFITLKDFDSMTLKNQLKNHLPYYMIPQQIIYCQELPRNSNGKLNRTALLEAI